MDSFANTYIFTEEIPSGIDWHLSKLKVGRTSFALRLYKLSFSVTVTKGWNFVDFWLKISMTFPCGTMFDQFFSCRIQTTPILGRCSAPTQFHLSILRMNQVLSSQHSSNKMKYVNFLLTSNQSHSTLSKRHVIGFQDVGMSLFHGSKMVPKQYVFLSNLILLIRCLPLFFLRSLTLSTFA